VHQSLDQSEGSTTALPHELQSWRILFDLSDEFDMVKVEGNENKAEDATSVS
jgi:hypothetical protein